MQPPGGEGKEVRIIVLDNLVVSGNQGGAAEPCKGSHIVSLGPSCRECNLKQMSGINLDLRREAGCQRRMNLHEMTRDDKSRVPNSEKLHR